MLTLRSASAGGTVSLPGGELTWGENKARKGKIKYALSGGASGEGERKGELRGGSEVSLFLSLLSQSISFLFLSLGCSTPLSS